MNNGIYYCKTYEINKILNILEKNLNSFFNPEEKLKNKKILLKPNLLSPKSPKLNITTNPAIIEAVIIYLKKYNAQIGIGDSPAGPITDYNLLIEKTNLSYLIEKYNIQLENIQKYPYIKYTYQNKDIYISSIINEYDYIINLPKFKTHALTTITGAVKNLFGLIPGMLKIDFHNSFDNVMSFCDALNFLANQIKNKVLVSIMDSIEAMEGDGPSSGKTVVLNTIIIGDSIYGTDITAANLTGIDIKDIPFLKLALDNKFFNINNHKIIHNEIQNIKKIKLPMQNIFVKILPFQFFKIASKICKIRPVINNDKCIKCLLCVKICPKKCISNDNDTYPAVNYKSCIQCFCCSEVCPNNAIILKDNFIVRLYKKIRLK